MRKENEKKEEPRHIQADAARSGKHPDQSVKRYNVDPSSREYWDPRRCLREPIPELFHAAFVLEEAVSALLDGDRQSAESLFHSVNSQTIRDYTESLWGSKKKFPEKVHYIRYRKVDRLSRPKEKIRDRKPGKKVVEKMIERDGYRCRYCHLPVIPAEVRKALNKDLPDAVPWGRKNVEQHAGFQALWLQIEHVTPWALGGDNSLENLVISCAGCNYGKVKYHLDELGLIDPLSHPPVRSSWNGLTHVLDAL